MHAVPTYADWIIHAVFDPQFPGITSWGDLSSSQDVRGPNVQGNNFCVYCIPVEETFLLRQAAANKFLQWLTVNIVYTLLCVDNKSVAQSILAGTCLLQFQYIAEMQQSPQHKTQKYKNTWMDACTMIVVQAVDGRFSKRCKYTQWLIWESTYLLI